MGCGGREICYFPGVNSTTGKLHSHFPGGGGILVAENHSRLWGGGGKWVYESSFPL